MFKRALYFTLTGILFWVVVGYHRLHAGDEVSLYPSRTKGVSWIKQSEIQSPSSVSFSFSVGCGFLYFYKVRGNLTPAPSALFSNYSGTDFGEVRRFSYNKTPMFEASVATRILPWLSGALSYYGQSGVSLESPFNKSVATGVDNNPTWASLRSDLQLYGLLFKSYLQSPYALVLGDWTLTPYLAIGVGPSWQTWSNICLYAATVNNNTYSSSVIPLRQKISANACWTSEFGLTFKPACPTYGLSIKLGCKYIDWGQGRSVGVLQQQGSKIGPFKPVSVKKVYSFVPFLGVQFNF